MLLVRKIGSRNNVCFSAVSDENTRSKFLFYGGPECVNIHDGLEYYIDSGIIPDFLGGPCPVRHQSHFSWFSIL